MGANWTLLLSLSCASVKGGQLEFLQVNVVEAWILASRSMKTTIVAFVVLKVVINMNFELSLVKYGKYSRDKQIILKKLSGQDVV